AGLLGLAAVASADGGQDPVDTAIRSAASSKGAKLPQLIKFIPFDSANKTSEATAADPSGGGTMRIVKGAYAAVAGLAPPMPELSAAATELEAKGFRLLA